MKMSIQDIEKIENYIEGNLPADEMESLRNDEKFQQEVKLHLDLQKAVVREGEKNLRTELNAYYDNYKNKKSTGKGTIVFFKVLAAAAVLLIVITIGIKIGENNSEAKMAEEVLLNSERNDAPEYATKKVYTALSLETYDFKNNVLKLYGRNFSSAQLNLYKIKDKVYIESGSDVYTLNENTLEVEKSDINLDSYKVLFPASQEKVTIILIENRQIVETDEKSIKVYK